MKASKKMVEGIAVAGLAAALTITSITTNGESAVGREYTTELEQNGVAGIAAAINAYGVEAADELDLAVYVEKEELTMVASSGEEAAVPESIVTEETEPALEEELTSEEEEWQDKLMADVKDFLYVREKPDADSKIVGKMYKGDRAVIKKEGDTWTKIASGNVKGYVKNEYCLFGQDALKYAKKHCDTVAKATANGLRVRSEADENASVVKALASGDKLIVDKKADEVRGWVAVKVNSRTCYVSAEYVTVKLDTGKAVTLEEEAAAQAAQAAASSNSGSGSGGQTSGTGTTQGPSLAASADEVTLLAALVQCEAGGCGTECMTAVGAVVLNRVRSGNFPNSIYGVIYQSGQFGPASSGRLEQRLAAGVSSSARQAAQAAINGADPTGGAKYFKLASSGHDGVVIGPIVFY
ncbi:MAG: cell wall hydrolase [Muribaculaceae bacterium]|nr:cell wall hydrolase [Roseburia sp.]MCM1429908.1 cell wall hydrolase [Muribaculaceae bacterium]MCM1494016.1 cell wall hydrolase [Muribaculaceae bacterium]